MKKLSLVLVGLLTVKGVAANIFMIDSGNVVDPTGSYYVGDINSSLNGVNVEAVCDDFSHEVSVGESWNVNIENVTPSEIGASRFDNFAEYQKAAWLTEQLTGQSAANVNNIQDAIWLEFDLSAPTSAAAQQWLSLANNQKFTANEFANVEIITPTAANQYQEYLMVTPEPPVILLLLMGLSYILIRKMYYGFYRIARKMKL